MAASHPTDGQGSDSSSCCSQALTSRSDIPGRRSKTDINSSIVSQARFEILTAEYMQRRRIELQSRCAGCWHVPAQCICATLHPILLRTPLSVAVFMHPREFGNAADSSKLLLRALPGSRLYVFGVREDEAALALAVQACPTVVLYPGPDAVAPKDSPVPALVVVLDGTWRQSRALRRRLYELAPGLPQIALSEGSASALNAFSRPRPSAARVSTVEALAALLDALGEDGAVSAALAGMVERNAAALRPVYTTGIFKSQ